MLKAYSLLAAAALLVNGQTLAPVIAAYHAAMVDHHPSPAAIATPAAPGVDVEKGRDGLFRITAVADNRPVRFIVDTGASVTVLSAQDAARLGLARSRAGGSGTLRTAGGAAAMNWQSLDRLDVAGSHLKDVDVVVVRGGPDHSLLGQDVLSQLGTVTMTSERLAIRPPTA